MRVAVIINKQCSQTINEADFQKIAASFSINCDIQFLEPEHITKALAMITNENYDALIIGGGDGTIRSIIEVVVNKKIPLAILPLGTFNHFAKTLDLTMDVEVILRNIALKQIKFVDIGQVNDTYFINNASIGLYPLLVKVREKYEALFSRNKIIKIFIALLNLWRPLRFYNIEMTVKKVTLSRKTFLLFIGNNYYNLDFFNFGQRVAVDEGELSVYIVNCKNRFQVLKLLYNILFNRFQKENYLEVYVTRQLNIYSRRKYIDVAVDGELIKLQMPLHFTIHNKALSIIANEL